MFLSQGRGRAPLSIEELETLEASRPPGGSEATQKLAISLLLP